MDATRITRLTSSMVSDCKKKRDACSRHVESITSAISRCTGTIESTYRDFAHTQFIHNIDHYGNSVVSIAEKAVLAEKANKKNIDKTAAKIKDTELIINATIQQLKAVQEEVSAKLAKDPLYIELTERMKSASLALEYGGPNFKEIESEANTKISQYTKDKVFHYLWSAGYGRDTYRGWPVIRWFDGLIATKYNYAHALSNFDLLNEIWSVAAESRKKLAEEFDRAKVAVSECEKVAHDTPEINGFKSFINDNEADLHRFNDEYHRYLSLEREFASANDHLSREAKSLILKALDSSDHLELFRLAAATISEDDDKALELLLSEVKKVAELEGQMVSAKEQLKKADTDLARANEAHRTVERDSRLSGSNYEYSSESRVGDILTGFILGSLSSRDLESSLRSASEYVPPPSYSSGKSGIGGGFGSSVGSFSTSNRSGGGSFTTSNKF